MKFEFEHVDGRVWLVVTLKIWGGDVTERHDITDKVMPVIDDYLDYHLELDFKKAREAQD